MFVDVVGRIENGDFETFKQKTDQIEASHPKKLVIVTLMSYGGVIHPAIQIGELVRKRRMLTFVPGDHTCASACALIWVSGWLRTVGDTPQIGFHAAYDKDTQRETGAANALVGAYLRDLEFSYKAIHFMTRKGPTDLEWLTPDLAKEVGVPWFMLQPPRAIPLPPQQPGLQPPLQVIAAWSKVMPRPVTASPERYTVVFKRPSQNPPEEPLPVPAVITPSPPPMTASPDNETTSPVHVPQPGERIRDLFSKELPEQGIPSAFRALSPTLSSPPITLDSRSAQVARTMAIRSRSSVTLP